MNTKEEFKSVLTKNQKKKVSFNNVLLDGQRVDLIIELRYDDECGNGHNTFSITGALYKPGSRSECAMISCGCLHDYIKKISPKYAKYIKWHLMGSDEPLHYVSNTLYHAGTKDCWGLEKGEVKRTESFIKFGDFPILFKKSKSFIKFIQSKPQRSSFNIIEVPHEDGGGYKYSSKYTFGGFSCQWHECPFDNQEEAEQFKKAFANSIYSIIKVPTAWGEGKEADLEAARQSAKAPEATLEQLQNKEWLIARLPQLKKEFKEDMEELGFAY